MLQFILLYFILFYLDSKYCKWSNHSVANWAAWASDAGSAMHKSAAATSTETGDPNCS